MRPNQIECTKLEFDVAGLSFFDFAMRAPVTTAMN